MICPHCDKPIPSPTNKIPAKTRAEVLRLAKLGYSARDIQDKAEDQLLVSGSDSPREQGADMTTNPQPRPSLVERLRELAAYYGPGVLEASPLDHQTHKVMREAADALEAAERQNIGNANAFDELSQEYLARAEAAERQRDTLAGALRWYADPSVISYTVSPGHNSMATSLEPYRTLAKDNGLRARSALTAAGLGGEG